MSEWALLASYTGVGLSIITLLVTQWRLSGSNTKEHEKRHVEAEQNKFTPEDRECLIEMKTKLDLIWSVYENDFPKFLRQEHTPELDIMLDKVHLEGLDVQSKEFLSSLIEQLDRELILAKEKEDSGRAMAIALYKTVVEYKTRGLKNKCSM